MAETHSEKARRLRKELETASKAAINELLEKKAEIEAELKELGYNGEVPKKRGRPKASPDTP